LNKKIVDVVDAMTESLRRARERVANGKKITQRLTPLDGRKTREEGRTSEDHLRNGKIAIRRNARKAKAKVRKEAPEKHQETMLVLGLGTGAVEVVLLKVHIKAAREEAVTATDHPDSRRVEARLL